jgi:EmrB/QacA subfamily drug resistance transporter
MTTATAGATATAVPSEDRQAAAQSPPGALSLLVLLSSTFVTSLDVFIVNVAIPSMQRDLGTTAPMIQWVVAGFSLAVAACLITAGRLGDIFGRRRVFALGLALFTLASVGCGLAPTAGTLVAGRIVQGAAAALLTPQVLALLRTAYSGAAQAKAFSMYGLTMGVGAVFGQLIGGLLIKADLLGLGWRACFLINLPVGAAALLLVRRALPESRAERRPGLDPAGLLLSSAALVALVLPLIQGRDQGWPLWTWLCLAASAALFAVFGWYEHAVGRRGGDPVVDTVLLTDRRILAGLAAQVVFWSGQASFFLILALYLQSGRGLSPLTSGLVFLTIGATYLVTSITAHLIADRLRHLTVPVGALIMAAGLGLLWLAEARTGTSGSAWWLAPGLLVDGFGMGMVIAPLTSNVLRNVAPSLAGPASGLIATVQQVGGALGVALIGIVFYGAAGSGAPADIPHAFGLGLAALTAVEVALAALTLAGARAGGEPADRGMA